MALHTADDPGPVETEPDLEEYYSKLPLCSIAETGGTPIKFPASSIVVEGGQRLVFRERPNRSGVKIDTTGATKRVITVEAEFTNEGSRFEEGLDRNTPLYPDVMNKILDFFDANDGATYDVVISTIGQIRARCHTYRRMEKSDERDVGVCSLVFVEDNEDDVDASAIEKLTVKGSGDVVIQKAQFDGESIGAWSGSLAGLLDGIKELQAIVNLPGTFLDDVSSNSTALIRTIEDFVASFSDSGDDARSMFTDPTSSRLARRLVIASDSISGSRNENTSRSQKKVTDRVYERDYSIFDIAALEKQDAKELMELNQYRIEDVFKIEAGTQILIFA